MLLLSFIYYSPLLFFKKIIPIKSNNNVTSETIDYLLVKTSFGLSLNNTYFFTINSYFFSNVCSNWYKHTECD